MSDQGLISARLLDGKGGGRPLDWDAIPSRRSEEALVWVHLNYSLSSSMEWLQNSSGLDPLTIEALASDDPRPRVVIEKNGLFLVARGVNLNPDSALDDMVALRCWVEEGRIITARQRKVMAVDDIRARIDAGTGPVDAGDFLASLFDRLAVRMASAFDALDDQVDDIEEAMLESNPAQLRIRLSAVRRHIIKLRRHLSPQREAMRSLLTSKLEWLSEIDRARLRESTDRITRYVEDLDAARDRAAVARDELESRIGEGVNRNMYVLSVIAAVFLPLGFLTGLLGINVGGMPGTENPNAFTIVTGLLTVLAVGVLAIFKRMRWI